jgi:hypothetical protein
MKNRQRHLPYALVRIYNSASALKFQREIAVVIRLILEESLLLGYDDV